MIGLKDVRRDRFAAAMMETRAQLLEYRDRFEEKAHREMLTAQVGMELFRPCLAGCGQVV